MYPKFWKFWKILGIFRICDGESPAKIRRIANFFSRNRRICAGDPTSQTRRTCEKFAARILRKCTLNAPNSVLKFAFATRFRRICDAFSPATAHRRRTCEFFRILRNATHFRRRIAGAFAPAIRRRKRVALANNSRPRILRKCALNAPNSVLKFAFATRFRRICDAFSPATAHRRRTCEFFRILRICVALRRRIAGANENYFSQKI